MSIVDDFKGINQSWKALTGHRPQEKWAIFGKGASLHAWLSLKSDDTFDIVYLNSARTPTLYATQQKAQNALDGVRSRTGDFLSATYFVRKYTK